jgi:hypothetical protein
MLLGTLDTDMHSFPLSYIDQNTRHSLSSAQPATRRKHICGLHVACAKIRKRKVCVDTAGVQSNLLVLC